MESVVPRLRSRVASRIRLCLAIGLFAASPPVYAVNYSLPADIGNGAFSNCSGGGPTYNCSDNISFNNDTVTLTGNVTLDINGNLTIGNNVNFNNGGFAFNINPTGNVDIGNNNNLQADFTINGNFTTGNGNVITGNITTNGNVDLGNNNTVNGDVNANGNIDTGNGNTINGNCNPNHPDCNGGPPGGGGGSNATIILSTWDDETLGGLSFGDDDLVEYDGPTDTSTLFFDGGSIFSSNGEDIDAVHVLDNGNIVLSTVGNATIGGLNITDGDLAEYDPINDTATTLFDESNFSNNADVNAVFVRADGFIILSTDENENLGGLNFEDEDLVLYDPVNDTATLFLDGDAVFSGEEDIDGVYLLPSGNILLSTDGSATIGSLDFLDGDIVEYDPNTGTATLFFSESSFSNNADVSAFHVGSTTLTALAYYAMDEFVWNGTPGEVIDSSTNGNDGTAVGNVVTIDPGRVCLGGDVPFNNSDAAQDAIDTGLDMDSDIGTRGTISFWYKSNTVWNGGGDRMLVDASTTADNKYFFVMLTNNGSLRFRIEDSTDADHQLDTSAKAFAADEWHHIAVTWNLPGDRLEIYIDGALDASLTPNTSGAWGALGTVYLGDNRSTYHPSGTANSANGVIDEARIYTGVQSAALIMADMNATQTCVLRAVDNFLITPAQINASTCRPNAVTIVARDSSDNILTTYAGTVTVSTSTGNGNWSVNTADNVTVPSPHTLDDGAVDYTFLVSDAGDIILDLRNTHAETLNITVSDAVASVADTYTGITFSDNAFVVTEDLVQVAGRPQAMIIEMVTTDPSDPTGCGVDPNYTYTHNLDVGIDRGGVLPGANPPSIGGNPINNGPPASIQFAFTAGVASFNLDTDDVGQYRLNFTDNNSVHVPGAITGDSPLLTVRPFGIGVDNLDFLGTANPGGTLPGDPVFGVAGGDFSAEVFGALWDPLDDSDNGGLGDGSIDAGRSFADNSTAPSYAWDTTLSVSAAALSYTPSTGTPGALNNATILLGEFSGGSFNVGDLQYTEVGSFTLQSLATDYLGVAGLNIVGEDIVVGRFLPAAFTVENIASGQFANSCSVFTYIGEDFGYETAPSFTVTARNALGAQTLQYRDGFAKLDGDDVLLEVGDDETTVGTDSNPMAVAYNAAASMGFSVQNDGTVDYVFGADTYRYGPDAVTTFSKSANSQVGPFASDINPEIRTVNDGEVSTTYAVDTYQFDVGSNSQRFGRLRMENTFGPEINALRMPVITEFWNGTAFERNLLDTCTTIADANLLSTAVPLGLSTPTVIGVPASAGQIDYSYPAPGAGNVGYVDTITDLNAAGLLWLRYDWDPDNVFDDNPSARANFGIFSGDPVQIYIQQIYEN